MNQHFPDPFPHYPIRENVCNPGQPLIKKNDLLTRPGWMEDCNAMHKCWTICPLHRQKLILANAIAQPIWDFWQSSFE